MLRYFYDSVKLRTEELAELTENSGCKTSYHNDRKQARKCLIKLMRSPEIRQSIAFAEFFLDFKIT